jgi:hypothetical protein
LSYIVFRNPRFFYIDPYDRDTDEATAKLQSKPSPVNSSQFEAHLIGRRAFCQGHQLNIAGAEKIGFNHLALVKVSPQLRQP